MDGGPAGVFSSALSTVADRATGGTALGADTECGLVDLDEDTPFTRYLRAAEELRRVG